MNANLHRSWTQDEFFAWAEKQDLRYEFDGAHSVATAGGTMGHGDVTRNLHGALLAGLRGGPCKYYGSEAGGVATTGKTVRYPDATITCSKQEHTSRLIADPVVVFEIVSPSSLHMDHVVKVREYATVMIESTSIDATVMERKEAGAPWVTTSLTKDDILRVPEVGIEIPVAELYEGVTFSEEEPRGDLSRAHPQTCSESPPETFPMSATGTRCGCLLSQYGVLYAVKERPSGTVVIPPLLRLPAIGRSDLASTRGRRAT